MAIPSTEYMLLRGKVALVELAPTTNVTGKVLYTGNCPSFKLSLKTDSIDHFESMSGLNQQDRKIVKTIGAEVSLELENIAKEVAALLVWGTVNAVTSLATQFTILPSGIIAGDTYLLKDQNLTVVTVEDAAGTPAVVPGTKYTVDPIFGTIVFNDVATYVQPFKVKYTRGAISVVPFFATQQPTRYIRFEGTNIGNPGNSKNHIVELYSVPLEPVSDLDIISETLGKFSLKGAALIDTTRASDANLGQFGRIVYL